MKINRTELSTLLTTTLTAVALLLGAAPEAQASDCCEPHGYTGCDDPLCESTICSQDPFCCDTEWDSLCSDAAGAQCLICSGEGGGETGGTGGGDCCEANLGGSGCDDTEVVYCVCALEPFCCSNYWAQYCVDLARTECGAGCEYEPECTADDDCYGPEICANGTCMVVACVDKTDELTACVDHPNFSDMEWGACSNIESEELCSSSYHETSSGDLAPCFWNESYCIGCGPSNTGTCGGLNCSGEEATCEGWPNFAGGPYESACWDISDPELCASSHHMTSYGELAPCHWDGSYCVGCGPYNNSYCGNVSCTGPAGEDVCDGRTNDAGGPYLSACWNIQDQETCDNSFHTTYFGNEAPCHWDGNYCVGCGPWNQDYCGGLSCEAETCGDLQEDAGGPGDSACSNIDDPDLCNNSFHHTSTGDLAPCHWDGSYCIGCGPANAEYCGKSCAGAACEGNDIDAGGPGTGACYDQGDQASCENAYHTTSTGELAPCLWMGSFCVGCGPANAELCDEVCVAGGAACGTNTHDAGGPGDSACWEIEDEGTCEDAYHTTGSGEVAPCKWFGSYCQGCGPENESLCSETCEDTGEEADPCPARPLAAGGPYSNACWNIEDEATCEASWHLTSYGNAASCYWDGSSCLGCGPANDGTECVNACIPECSGDPARSLFAGGPSDAACHKFDGDEAACNAAYHQTSEGFVASCNWDGTECHGCGYGNAGNCTNTCEAPACAITDCCVEKTEAGCLDSACEPWVCELDSYCCDEQWDSACAEIAQQICSSCIDDSDCCYAHDDAGCADSDCMDLICESDDFCCTTTWDAFCADNAEVTCEVCEKPEPISDCCELHAGVGCEDAICQATICQNDAFCCDNIWDDLCAEAALEDCEVCGGSAVSDCCFENDVLACDDDICAATVCALDATCCADEASWTIECAALAEAHCSACGAAGESSCCYEHDSADCDDGACQTGVCAIDPFCCDQTWDDICVLEAFDICSESVCDYHPDAGEGGDGGDGGYGDTGPIGDDLLVNGGAEDAPGSLPGWTVVSGTGWTTRASNPASYEGGVYFFAGAGAIAELEQVVDVSDFSGAIAAGEQRFSFTGYVRSFSQSPPDYAQIIVEYLDADGNVLSSFDTGQTASTSAWQLVTDTQFAPVGTVAIKVRLISTRQSGTNNDGYFDGMSLVALPLLSQISPLLPDRIVDLKAEGTGVDGQVRLTWTAPGAGGLGHSATDPGVDCVDIAESGVTTSGAYWIDPDGAPHDDAFQVYCEMETDGGGWTMCYSDNHEVHIKTETAYSPSKPYGSDGYRADCRDVEFKHLVYVNHDSDQVAWFERQTQTNIKMSATNYSTWGGSYGQWTPKGDAATNYNYQLNICDNGWMWTGLMMTGYTGCWKYCWSWCGDGGSPYFRMDGDNGGSYNGVAFNENGHKNVSGKLMSVGMRSRKPDVGLSSTSAVAYHVRMGSGLIGDGGNWQVLQGQEAPLGEHAETIVSGGELRLEAPEVGRIDLNHRITTIQASGVNGAGVVAVEQLERALPAPRPDHAEQRGRVEDQAVLLVHPERRADQRPLRQGAQRLLAR